MRTHYARATAEATRGKGALVVEWSSPGIRFRFVHTQKLQGDLMTKKLSQVNYTV